MENTQKSNKIMLSTVALASLVGAVGVSSTSAFAADETAMTKVEDKDANKGPIVTEKGQTVVDKSGTDKEQVVVDKSDATKEGKQLTLEDITKETPKEETQAGDSKDVTLPNAEPKTTDAKTSESDDAVGKNKERATKEVGNLTHLTQAQKDGFLKNIVDAKDSNTVLNILNDANKTNAQAAVKKDEGAKNQTTESKKETPIKQNEMKKPEVKPVEVKNDLTANKTTENKKDEAVKPKETKKEDGVKAKVITPAEPTHKSNVTTLNNTSATVSNSTVTPITNNTPSTTDKQEDKKVTFKSKEEVLAQLKKMTGLPKADLEKYEKEINEAKSTDEAVSVLEKANVGYTGAGSLEELKKEQAAKVKAGQLPNTGVVETTSAASLTTASILLGLILKARKQ